MAKVHIEQMPRFKKVYKKLHSKEREIVDEVIEKIVKDPKVGVEKKGELSSVFVYKFKMHRQEMLLAYEWIPKIRTLLALGVHENFYRDLKKTV